ncbi:uncharacterized protein LOC135468240 [Liolophura sinensis]|uniref:uncharacterized protein LOC135468240 n=1 Tax=Liolophura sinensis TaxID=3198878 RepID=UPI00315990FF
MSDGIPHCSCGPGYTLHSDGLTCTDVDECVQYAHICSHSCRNIAGGFVCDCQSGYRLHSDGRTCNKVEEPVTDTPSAEDPSAVPYHWRQYIDDMLDPHKPSPEEPAQRATQPKMSIKARVRTTKQRGIQEPYVPPSEGTDTQDRPSFVEHDSSRQPTHLHGGHPSLPHQPGPGFRSETSGHDPYNLPSQFNPNARYEQLPPELTKQMFGKYDRKKLVPFDFEDQEYQEPFRKGGPSAEGPGSRAIFWEEIPTDIATTLTKVTPCGSGYNCPDALPEFADPSFQVPDLADPFLQAPNPPLEPPPAVIPIEKQRLADRGSLNKPQIKTKKVSRRKEHRPRGHKHRRRHRKGKTRNKKTKTDKTKPSPSTYLKKPTTSASNSKSKLDGEQWQKDGKACRGDLCYFPEESEEENVTPFGVVQTDDFGQCPEGFELLIVNDFQVCKPLAELARSRTFPAALPTMSTTPHQTAKETGNNVDSDIAIDLESEVESVKSVPSTRPPFINFCVKEGKIMIITAKGIHCKHKSEENIFVDCEEHEVYVETVAGYICRDPSTEDILSTPIQCPSGHTLIKTNTGYECRGTVVLESSCPENYETVQTMSGTICSPSSPFTSTGKTTCPPGTVLTESEKGTECLHIIDELLAATTVVSDDLVTTDHPREYPIGLPPKPDVPTTSPVPDLTTASILCPPGQIGVQTDTGPVCKYYTKLERGRGDLPPFCPEGRTMMNTESGLLCIGASVMVEYDGPVTLLYSETEESGPNISPCPKGQVLVSTEDGEKCQDLQRPFVLPTDDILLVRNVCPHGQVAVNTSDGSECRWIGIEKETGPEPLCPEGCSIQQTNFGLLCINDTTGEPALDGNFSCPDGQIALFTPKGSMCKSEGVIVGKILTVTEIDDLQTEPGCGLDNLVFQTLAGPLCLDKVSREPVIHEEKICPDSELGVLSPSGVVCKLRSDILLYTLTWGSCSIGQTVAATEAGSICVYQDTKYPVFDDSIPCPDGQAPVVTPSGTFCKLRSAIVTSFEETDASGGCQSGQTVLETAAGAICINSETLLPIIDESISCAEGHVPIVTPGGTFCRHRLSLLTRLSEKQIYACADGQTIVETEAGAICIHSETLEPVIDESVSRCQNGQAAVVTPSGTRCKPRLSILTRLVKKPKGDIKTETEISTHSCVEGQKILETEAGAICIHSETLQPVIDETVSCIDGQTPIVTPTGTLCKLHSAILTRLTVDESDKHEISTEFETLSCSEGQEVLETAAGAICIHGETYQPVIDESLSCPDSQAPVVTPAGTLCKLRSLILTPLSETQLQTCAEDHKVLETDAGLICIHNMTLQPIVDERVSCPDGQAPVVTPNGTLCILRSAILQKLPKVEGPVCEGHQLLETEAGAVCFHNWTMQPMIDQDSVCPDGQISVLTPTGACCKLHTAVLTILNENGTLTTQSPVPSCDEGQRILKTEAGIICIHTNTLQPVVDGRITCPVDYTPIITPTGSVCTRHSAILTRLSETGTLFCTEGQDILETEIGPICTQGEISRPIVDHSLSCPQAETPTVTPVGTACMPSSIIEGLLEQTGETGSCGIGRRIHETEGGLICVDKETDQPVIDEGMFCPEGQAAVVSPTGTFCMLHAIIYGRLSRIPAKSTYMSMTTPSTPESCQDGQFVLQTDAGPICVYVETQDAVVDVTVSCPDGLLPVVAPSGTFCLLQTKIFAKLSQLSVKTNDSFSENMVNVTEEENACGEGQRVHKQKSQEICVYEETSEPVLDFSITCPKSKIAVLTPTGFVCKSQRSIYGKKKFVSEITKSAMEDNDVDEVDRELSCGSGSKVYQTEDGLICIDTETEEPIFDESVTCPDSKVPYVTPSGTVCKLRLRETDAEASRKDRFEEDLANTCGDGQKMLSISAGVICVHEDSLEPVIDESVFCPQGKVAVRTPSGTSCRLEERIFVTSTTEFTTLTTAEATTPTTAQATIPTTAQASTPSITVSTKSTVPTCPLGEKLVIRQNQYICEMEQSLTTQTTISEAPTCGEGQIVGESELGMVCLYHHSLKTVIDEQVECDLGDIAVVTPHGTVCMLRTVILKESAPTTPLSRPAPAPAPTASVPICPRGLTPVLRNGQFVCRHVIVSKANVEPSTARPEQTERCDVGQRIYLTSVGKICVQEHTLEPVINRSVSCSSGDVAVFTPSGVACKNRTAIYQSLPNPTEAPEVTETYPDVDKGCPEGQVVVSHNGQLICRPDDEVNTGGECPPGYQKVMIEGLTEYQCQYVGFSTDKGSREAERNYERNLKCPFGLVLTHTPNGPACRYPSKTSRTAGTGADDLPAGANNIPDSSFIPPVVTDRGQPCSGGTNCGGENTRPHGQTVTCPEGVNCVGFRPGVHVPVAPCLQGINCAVPVVRTPVVSSGCFNGIQIANGQPCASMPGVFPQLSNTPCGSGSNCGIPCSTSNCRGGAVVPPMYNGCGNGGTTAGGCGIQPRPSYPFSVTQSCSNGFQPYQRGKIYMCVPLKIQGLCGSNVMLKTLLGSERCNGVHQAVPPHRSITPCTLNNGYPITGKLSSACTPLDGLTPVEGAEGVCRAGEQLFQSARGRTVCLPVSSIAATSAPEVQQEALPTCRTSERLVKTDRGYICQRLPSSGCNPECANGGTCDNGVCRCPRGLSGSSCQTDIDECKRLPERHCHYKCMNGFGSYRCVCPTGYTLNADRRTCKAIRCTPECRNGGTCVGGVCRCTAGFTGRQCEIDVDECSGREGLCEYQCRNTVGSYTCVCSAGSRLREDGRSCERQSCMPSCQNGATCKDHRCFCAPGYYGVSCQLDINECFHFRPCSHLCHNTKGSYVCACRSGFRLASDGHMCLRNPSPESPTRRRRRPRTTRRRKATALG